MKLLQYTLVGALSLGLATSCSDDYLETVPTTSISEKTAASSEAGLKAMVNGLHNMSYIYSWSQPYGSGQASLAFFYDVLGDDMINTRPAYHMSTYRWQEHILADGSDKISYRAWDYYYTLILHANRILLNVDNVQGLSDEAKNEIKGTALAYRAWSYHYLVQLFGKRFEKGAANDNLGVILRLGDKQFEPLPRSTVAETYAQINKDIEGALTCLKAVPATTTKNTMRYATACGIASRIALTQEDWAGAEKYAKEAIDNAKGNSLQSGASLSAAFSDMNQASEWMWAYTQAEDQPIYYTHFNAVFSYNFVGHNNSLRFAVNRSLFDKMGPNDARRKWWVCMDLGDKIPSDANTNYFKGGMDANKAEWERTGQSIKFKSKDKSSSVGDVVLMRLAEMYYNLAEAQYRQGKEAEAQATLATIMATRDPDYVATAYTGTALIDEIMRNKRLDFWGEGLRFFDMKRLKEVPHRLDAANFKYLSGSVLKLAKDRNTGDNAKYIPTTADHKAWQFAIPYQEIKGNPSVQQNEL